MKMTIIFPTLNRSGQLREAVASARAQTLADEDFEIMVVDNGSTDDTRDVVAALNALPEKPVRYVFEKRPGLHWARHAAAKAAEGDLLAYTDDDCVLTPHWAETIMDVFKQEDCAVAGGPIRVDWIDPPPAWAPKLYKFGYLDLGPERKELAWPQFVYGGNIVVKKALLMAVGGFNPDTSYLDRLVGDGEMGLCRKIYAAGGRIVYEPRALVYHRQFGSTQDMPSMRHRYAQQARFQVYAEYKQNPVPPARLALKALEALVRGVQLRYASATGDASQDVDRRREDAKAHGQFAASRYYARMALSGKFRRIVERENWLED